MCSATCSAETACCVGLWLVTAVLRPRVGASLIRIDAPRVGDWRVRCGQLGHGSPCEEQAPARDHCQAPRRSSPQSPAAEATWNTTTESTHAAPYVYTKTKSGHRHERVSRRTAASVLMH
jgi:hypothetical protein